MKYKNSYTDLLEHLDQRLNTSEKEYREIVEMEGTILQMKRLNGLNSNGKKMVAHYEKTYFENVEEQLVIHQDLLKLLHMNSETKQSFTDAVIKFFNRKKTQDIEERILCFIFIFEEELKYKPKAC